MRAPIPEALLGAVRCAAPWEESDSNFVDITCPDCRGRLKEYHFGKIIEYRCRIGHAHSPLSTIEPHREAQERVRWAALVALEEGATYPGSLLIQLAI